MIIVLDTNILISALIRDSVTREIIMSSGLDFRLPELSMHEIRKHKTMILGKSGLPESAYENTLNKLMEYVLLIPTEEIKEMLDDAKKIMLHIDPNDVVFLAAAMAYPSAIIWSDDRHFERQKKVAVVKTEQLFRMFYKA